MRAVLIVPTPGPASPPFAMQPFAMQPCPIQSSALGDGVFLRLDHPLAAWMTTVPAGIALPACEGARDVAALGTRLAVAEAEAGLPDGATRILAVIATARGVLALPTLTRAGPRLAGIAFDAQALGAEIGAPAVRDGRGDLIPPLARIRDAVRLVAAAAGVEAVDTPYPLGGGEDGLRHEVATGRRDGFAAKLALSPEQAALIRHAAAS